MAQPGQQEAEKGAPGLFTHPNPFALPRGAVVEAENAVVSREGIYSRRRGFDRYGDQLNSDPSEVTEYDGTLIVKDGSTLKYDSDDAGTWTAYTGGYEPPAGANMRFLEAAENFYFTTTNGPHVLDTATGTPVRAGIPPGLDMQLSLTGTGDSWFTANTQVGYRMTWRREDANGNVKQGAPSYQEVLANALTVVTWDGSATPLVVVAHTAHGYTTGDTVEVSGSSDSDADGSYVITVNDANEYQYTAGGAVDASGTANAARNEDVTVTFTIPDDIVVDDEWEVWRTELAPGDDDSPSDNHRLVGSGKIVAGDLTTGTITWTDDENARDAANLYTNATSTNGGIAQANHRPPLCQYMVEFEGHTFYGGETSQPHELEIRLLNVDNFNTSASVVYIQESFSKTTFLYPRTTEDASGHQFKVWTTYATLAENVRETMRSLVRAVNRGSSWPYFYAHYVSLEDDLPGKVLITARQPNDGQFSLGSVYRGSASEPLGSSFSPALPNGGGPTSSSNSKSNVWYRSKFGQPEAVPRLNQERTGSANKASLGIVALDKAAIVYREDGLFTISGTSDGGGGFDFVVDELDPTVRNEGANTIASLNNAAVAHTNQGAVRAAQGVPTILSRPGIE